MASRVKEEEKIERTIRNLMKLPENRRCINCNSLGPQYVCTTFLTFVCTNCSGVHREFTHRVKSVSMAKFKADEVAALQAAGNERARQIYLKAWDPQRHSYPDCSNLHGLRDFIKHVYVDRKYTGEKTTNELPKLRINDKDSSQERRKITPYYGGLRGPQGEMSNPNARRDRRSSVYYYDERSSPRYAKENSRSGGYRKGVTHIEVVDDRIRDDRHGNIKLPNGESKSSSQVSNSQENLEKSSPAVVCYNKDVSGENKPPRIVGEDVKANKGMDAGGSDQDQNSVRVNPVETRRDTVVSLIDFDVSSEPSDATSQIQQMPSSNNNGNWDAFELSEKKNTSVASSENTLEALFFELSVPSTEAETKLTDGSGKAASPSNISGSTLSGAVAPDLGQTALPISVEASAASPSQLTSNKGGDIPLAILTGQLPPSTQQKHACNYPSTEAGLNSQLTAAAVVPNFEVELPDWTSSPKLNAQGYLIGSADKVADTGSKPAPGSTTGVEPQPPSLEVNSCGRKEIPADLFTIHYLQVPTPVPGWQSGTHHVMNYCSHYYPNTVSAVDYANSARRANPFDLDDGKSRLNFQSAPNGKPASTGLIHPSNYQAQYSDIYMGQQAYGTPSLRSHGVDNYGSIGPAFGSLKNTNLQPSSGYPTPNTNQISPSSGTGSNPFG